MIYRTVPAIVVAGLLALPSATMAHEPRTRSCGQVAFTPDSDDVAANIRATGLTCGLARDFVRDSSGRPGERFRGFRCESTAVENPEELPYARYRCVGDGDVIRWRRY